MQTKLIDSLQLDVYAREQPDSLSSTLDSPAYAACMQGVDAGQTSDHAQMQAV